MIGHEDTETHEEHEKSQTQRSLSTRSGPAKRAAKRSERRKRKAKSRGLRRRSCVSTLARLVATVSCPLVIFVLSWLSFSLRALRLCVETVDHDRSVTV